jgi:hypothetical protein
MADSALDLESPQVLLKALARLWWPALVRYLRIELGGSSVHFFEGCKGAGRNVLGCQFDKTSYRSQPASV